MTEELRRPLGIESVVDWRVWKAAEVAAVSGDSGNVKPGHIVYSYTALEDSALGPIGFITPSPVALFLNLGVNAANRATATLASLVLDRSQTPPTVHSRDLKHLYSYFEDCFASIVATYQAVEAFANQIVVDSGQESFTVDRKKRSRQWTETLPREQVELTCSLREKLLQVLPQATKQPLTHADRVFLAFRELEGLRHSVVHLKRVDQYRYGSKDNKTLYYRLMVWKPTDSVRAALGIIRHFHGVGSGAWLEGVEVQLRANVAG